jgi:outer membrane biosynthesis protein TonB
MNRALRGPLWLLVAAVALGLLAWRLGLDRSDKLASIGSCILALIALAAAAGTHLRPNTHEAAAAPHLAEPPSTPAPAPSDPAFPRTPASGEATYFVVNHGNGPMAIGPDQTNEFYMGTSQPAHEEPRDPAPPADSL